MTSINEADYRKAMSLYAAGVSVVAADNGDEAHALTASSFTSVSLKPPLLLVCISERSPILPIIRSAERFALNILRDSQAHLGTLFATASPTDRRAALDRDQALGRDRRPPSLRDPAGPLVRFDCALDAEHVAGDHSIILGRPIDLQADLDGAPLVWWRGRLRAAPEDTAS